MLCHPGARLGKLCLEAQAKAILAEIDAYLKSHPGVDKRLPHGATLAALQDSGVQIGVTVTNHHNMPASCSTSTCTMPAAYPCQPCSVTIAEDSAFPIPLAACSCGLLHRGPCDCHVMPNHYWPMVSSLSIHTIRQ